MSLDGADILELKDRYYYLMTKYVELAKELAPKLDKFGKYRKELQLLSVEFIKRGVSLEDPDGLKKLIEEELEKRKQMTDGEDQNK